MLFQVIIRQYLETQIALLPVNCTRQFSILVFCFSKAGLFVENENVMPGLMKHDELKSFFFFFGTFAVPGYYEI